jgi:tetratricopeptide (TPR) repeat protein
VKRLSVVIVALSFLLGAAGLASAQNFKLYSDRGVENCQNGRYDQSIQDFNEALKLKPADPEIITLRGVAYYAKGLNDKALEDFNQAIKLNPKYARAYYQRGMVYQNTEKYDRAAADLKQAKSLGYHIDPVFLEFVERKAAEHK